MTVAHHELTLHLQDLDQALRQQDYKLLKNLLNNDFPAAATALFIEMTPANMRKRLWILIDSENQPEVLSHISDEVRSNLLANMSAEQIAKASQELDSDDLTDVLQELPTKTALEVLHQLAPEEREEVEELLSYDEDTAGGLMELDIVTVRADVTVEAVTRYLRWFDELPENLDSVFIVNRNRHFVGMLPILDLLINDDDVLVREIMDSDIEAIQANLSSETVAQLFERFDYVSAPVVDSQGKLVGRITVDDVVDVIRDQGEHSMLAMAGLDEDSDTLAGVWQSTKDRAIWLGINLITACLAALTIGLFEESIQKNSILSLLMGVVASMGGVAGSQTLTLVIRGYAVGQITPRNFRWLLMREIGVALINGIIWALVAGAFTYFWKQDLRISIIMAASVICTLIVAKTTGALLPMILRKMHLDPAISGSVVLTTITDIVGFFTFLGLATWLLF
jgi:magnesium transporter